MLLLLYHDKRLFATVSAKKPNIFAEELADTMLAREDFEERAGVLLRQGFVVTEKFFALR